MSPLRVDNDVCFGSVYNLRTEEQYPLVSVALFIIACRIVMPLRLVPLNIGYKAVGQSGALQAMFVDEPRSY